MTLASRFPIRNLRVEILKGVVIKEVNWPMMIAMEAIFLVCWKQGRLPVMTGASQSAAYSPGGIHDSGSAWDFRSKHLPRPKTAFLELAKTLKGIDVGFRVLYHDVGYGKHFHVEYREGTAVKP